MRTHQVKLEVGALIGSYLPYGQRDGQCEVVSKDALKKAIMQDIVDDTEHNLTVNNEVVGKIITREFRDIPKMMCFEVKYEIVELHDNS